MAYEQSSVNGSGLSVLAEQSPGLVGFRGSVSIIGNYEDINSCLGLASSSGISVTSQAVPISSSGISGRRKLIIQNLGADNIFLGGEDVTTSNGLRLGSGELRQFDVLAFGTIWAVSEGTSDVRRLELK